MGFGIVPSTEPVHLDGPGQLQASTRRPKVLVVDQDPSVRRIMTARLGSAGYLVSTASSAQAALDASVRSRPNLVISELRLDDMDGVALLRELKSRWPTIPVIILTTHATIPEAVQATQAGAFSFLVKPVGRQELLGHVERATAASDVPLGAGDWREQIVERSRLLEERVAVANRAAASSLPLLLMGATGTGKELFARAVHAAGARRSGPFVTVACRDREGREIDLDLFGEPRSGASAKRPRPGAFIRAHEGTLLIDDVGDLPPRLQSMLLEALRMPQNTVPAPQVVAAAKCDVRLVCTTSRDLSHLAQTGNFSHELFDQISVLPIETPPLGRRREDLPLLISHFLEQSKDPGSHEKLYTPEAIELLATTDWPANVKQLFDLVKQNVALSHAEGLAKEFATPSMPQQDSDKVPTYDEAREAFARAYLSDKLQRTAGNVTQAARIAKRTRTDFYKLLARYRLNPDDFKSAPRNRRGR